MKKVCLATFAALLLCSATGVHQVSAAPVYLSAPYTGSCDCGASSQSMNTNPGWWSTNPATGGIGIGAKNFKGMYPYWVSSWAEASLYKTWRVPSGWTKVKVTAVFKFTGGSEHLWTWPGTAWLSSTLRVGLKGNLARWEFSNHKVVVASKVYLPARWDKNAADYGTLQTWTNLAVKGGTYVNIAAGTNTACGVIGFSNANATYGVLLDYIKIDRIY